MVFFFQNIFLHLLLVIPHAYFFVNIAYSQDISTGKFIGKPDTTYIQWISQWHSSGIKHKPSGITGQVRDLILGKKMLNLSKPVSALADNQKTVWILDQGNNAIFKVSNETGEIPRFIEKKNIDFLSLVGICSFHPYNKQDEILFTDSYLNKIFRINSEKEECFVLNDSLLLSQPTGIAYSKVKNEIWVVETSAHRISVLNEKGERIKKIGSRGTAKGEFNFPTNIWIDMDGNAYVVDAMNFRVQILDKEGAVVSVFGTNGDATGYFASPKGIAVDSYGHIYVSDALFHAVQVFDIYGNFLYNFGSQGHEPEQFWMPAGIYIDDSDRIYIADSYNSRIQIFQLVTGNNK